jgi:hypothetical protein
MKPSAKYAIQRNVKPAPSVSYGMRIYVTLLLMSLLTPIFSQAAKAAAESCMAPPQPVVHVDVVEEAALFDMGKNASDLEIFRTEANSGHLPSRYHDEVHEIKGVTVGNFSASHDVEFRLGEAIASDEGCASIKNINITLRFKPIVYVANEFTDHACWFKEIFEHEARHVKIDRDLTAKYKTQIEETLAFAFKNPTDYSSGRIPPEDIEAARFRLNDAVGGALAASFDSLMREREDKQLTVDNMGEYTRIARACPAAGIEHAKPTPFPITDFASE